MSDGFYGRRLQFWQIYGYISFSIIHLELKRQKCSYALLSLSKIIFVDTSTPLGVTCLYSCYREVFQGFYIDLNRMEAR